MNFVPRAYSTNSKKKCVIAFKEPGNNSNLCEAEEREDESHGSEVWVWEERGPVSSPYPRLHFSFFPEASVPSV